MNTAQLLVVAFVLSGCSYSPAVDFFVLAPDVVSSDQRESDLVTTQRQLRIELRRPKIPSHLRRTTIVRRAAGGKLTVSDEKRWAGDLAEMIGEALSLNLGELLPGSVISTESAGLSGPNDVIVELEVSRFEPAADGKVHLDAQVALSFPSSTERRQGCPNSAESPLSKRSEQWESGNFAASIDAASGSAEDQVQAMSSLLGALSRSLSRSIAQGVASCASGDALPAPESGG